MDMITLGYYAAVCGLLGLLAPLLGGMLTRLIIGGIVGAGAVIALPWVTESLAAAGYVAGS